MLCTEQCFFKKMCLCLVVGSDKHIGICREKEQINKFNTLMEQYCREKPRL